MHSCLTEGFINHLMLIYISIYPGVYTLLFFFKGQSLHVGIRSKQC